METRILLLLLMVSVSVRAQVGVNTTSPNAQLDIRSSNQTAPTPTDGVLIPKIDAFPATNPTVAQQGMLVYLNVASGGNPIGFYYWNNPTLTWLPLKGTDGGTLDQAYDFGGAGVGRTITADAGAVTINGTDGLVSTGTLGSGALAPSGAGVKMFWNPRKAAFRAGYAFGAAWDDANVGFYSSAFGETAIASGLGSTAFGLYNTASGNGSTAFGESARASGACSNAFGFHTHSLGAQSTAFGSYTTASGPISTAFGSSNSTLGQISTVFGTSNTTASYGETVFGIGATDYTPSPTGASQFGATNATDRLLVVGNAIDNVIINGVVDPAERSDALIILKNGLTRLPSTTNAMINAADGKAVVTKEYLTANSSGTLDQAYDFGGAGAGRTITADTGAVLVAGADGLQVTGTFGSGATIDLAGAGTRMLYNPRKGAIRAGRVAATNWDDANVGNYSTAFGYNTLASGANTTAIGYSTDATGTYSLALGYQTLASGNTATTLGGNTEASGAGSTAMGYNTTATGSYATAMGYGTTAVGIYSTAGGYNTTANNSASTAFGNDTTASANAATALGHAHTAYSFGETVLGIGATDYTASTNGTTQFRAANATDRLLSIGNAIDANNNSVVDAAERSNALTILKNGRVALGNVAPGGQFELSLNEGRKPGSGTWTIVSDERLKTVDGDYTAGLSEIRQLHPIRYHYKNAAGRSFESKILATEFSGFLAQDVQRIFPNCVTQDTDGYLSLNIHDIIIASVNAVKELDAKNTQLTTENATLKSELTEQKELLKSLVQRIEALERK